ncbi:hypothetical protein LCGC14_1206920 [marine sediment metagenome]|uniref:DUF4062 domain-containing protein n=1 Tax=marine sediment metagenome TaxID=412755 RepID=A0A0F9LJL0_9ZZZZ
MDNVPSPFFLIIFPIKTFEFKTNKKVENSQQYLEIKWDLKGKIRDFIYITYKKGENDPIVIKDKIELIKIEKNFSRSIQIGIYWSGINDLLPDGCLLYTNEISYLKEVKKKTLKIEGKLFKIFISSTIQDEKQVLRTNIKEMLDSKNNIIPILSEYPETFPKPIDPSLNTFEASIAPIKDCQIFVLVIGKRYGNIEPGKDISIMEAEYDEAVRNHLPHIVFIDEEVIQDYDRFSTKDPDWDGKKIKAFRKNYLDLLKIKGYDKPAKIMKFITKLSKLKLTFGKKHKDNWYWLFSMNDTPRFLRALDAQIDFYVDQIEPTIKEMKNCLVRFSSTNIPEIKREISERFISWGPVGTQFLLDEHKTNQYGYSDVSGAVMDMSYPDWQKSQEYSTVIQYDQQIPVERTVSFSDQYREEKEKVIRRDQETFEAVEGFILKHYQMWYYRKCSELNELDEKEKERYNKLLTKNKNDYNIYEHKVTHRKDTLRNNFGLHFDESKKLFYNLETSIQLSSEGDIRHSDIRTIEESGMFIEEKIIDKINILLKSLRDYWKEANQYQIGNPEIKKNVEFEKELISELITLTLENGVWRFKK